MTELMGHVLGGGWTPPGFNDCVQAIAPKGSLPGDAEGTERRPSEMRPLALKHTANNLFCAALALAAAPALREGAARPQKCFVPARQLAQNLVAIDSQARCYGHQVNRGEVPAAIGLVFRAAFPSVLQPLLLVALEVSAAPAGMVQTVRAIYTGVRAVCRGSGASRSSSWSRWG